MKTKLEKFLRSELMKKVFKLFRGGSNKRRSVKWVQFLKWIHKFEALKGRKSWREKKCGQWGVSRHISGTTPPGIA